MFSGFSLSTTSPNIWQNRRYESHAKRALPLISASPFTVSSVSPRFSTVSIIPGIETRAPDRTDTSSGFFASPNLRPSAFSTRATLFATPSVSPFGYLCA